jgi:hypothetical protein
MLDERAFARIAAHHYGSGIVAPVTTQPCRECLGRLAETAMMDIVFSTASFRHVNARGCRLAELYAWAEKFIPRLFVSLLSH